MNKNQKFVLGFSFLVIAVLYWVLAPIGVWLTVDDSDAVSKFAHENRLIAAIGAMFWLLDGLNGIGFRYILIVILAATFWWITRNPPSKTS
jgi:hypothetical protein